MQFWVDKVMPLTLRLAREEGEEEERKGERRGERIRVGGVLIRCHGRVWGRNSAREARLGS